MLFGKRPHKQQSFLYHNFFLKKIKKSLITEGVNLSEIYEFYKYFDLNDIYTNDIFVILNTFGIFIKQIMT